ncbi:adenylosuccinate lyase [Flavobacteriaceae bacterium F89]|uniref:Adenylosuccinate lyase n=1 Tax=Cerina litoralis TaxID=2874477 RepID=A0AAE3ETG3_9FLAO|nr:adenylosuccinate lyase [Cerina litoralis]MCG2460820.1 adenylosuccinate lyase [Cerina litoralis]
MDKLSLYPILNYTDSSRQRRREAYRWITQNPNALLPLMEIAFLIDDPISCKACWVLEATVKENPIVLKPHIVYFTENIGSVHLDSAVRPIAKICEILMGNYFSQKKNEIQTTLSERDLELIATACFDWLIGPHKVAAQAYSMTSLFLLGKKFDWIHPQLKSVLQNNYTRGSAAYKARARMILKRLSRTE